MYKKIREFFLWLVKQHTMNHAKQQKRELPKKKDDCSSSSSSSSSDDCSHDSKKHDKCDEHGYKKRCECQRCVRKYDEWCKSHKSEGRTHCVRKSYTTVVVKCEKPVTTHFTWSYKKDYEGKWEPTKSHKLPEKCHDHDHHDGKK